MKIRVIIIYDNSNMSVSKKLQSYVETIFNDLYYFPSVIDERNHNNKVCAYSKYYSNIYEYISELTKNKDCNMRVRMYIYLKNINDKIKELLEKYLLTIVSHINSLELYNLYYFKYRIASENFNNILAYFYKIYNNIAIIYSSNIDTYDELYNAKWVSYINENIIVWDNVYNDVINILLNNIENNTIDIVNEDIYKFISNLKLNIYNKFEDRFVDDLKHKVINKRIEYIKTLDIIDYLYNYFDIGLLIHDLYNSYIAHSTFSILDKYINLELCYNQSERLINNFYTIVSGNNIDAKKILYLLIEDNFNKKDDSSLSEIYDIFLEKYSNYVIHEISILECNVDNYITFYINMKYELLNVYNNNYKYIGIFEKNFSKYLNKITDLSKKFPLYLHNLIKKTSIFDILSRDSYIEKAIGVSNFVNEKDVFQIYYNKYLVNRLLLENQTQENNQANYYNKEKEIYNIIRDIEWFTDKSKQLIIIEDSSKSIDLNNEFKEIYLDNTNNFNIFVGTNGIFPISIQEDEYNDNYIPDIFKEKYDVFSDFFKMKYEKRKLYLSKMLSSVNMEYYINNSTYNITCNLYEAYILLKYNENDTILILDDDLTKCLELNSSLTKLLKIKLIKSIGDNNYKLNKKFKYKSIDIDFKKIRPILREKPKKPKSIEINREIITQCAIVKTMKQFSSQEIEKEDLFNKIKDNKNVLKYFKLDDSFFDTQLNKLEEKEYINITNNMISYIL